MGKIRVKTLGIEDQEQEEKKKAKARAEAKKAEAAKQKAADAGESAVETTTEDKEKKKANYKKTVTNTKQKHSHKYAAVTDQVDRSKKYSLHEALEILPKVGLATFDETVELHINTTEKGISGSVTLPHGTGKEVRVAIANQTEDAKGVDQLIKDIEAGQITFDVLIATPDAMPKLARVARVLGPRGLMPNPKNGTVSPKPEEVSKKFQGGQINFKTESKFPILHLAVGKVSFGDKKLADNIKTIFGAIKMKSIKNVTLKSTMSPGLKIDTASL